MMKDPTLDTYDQFALITGAPGSRLHTATRISGLWADLRART